MAVLNFLSRIYGIFFLTASIAMVRLSYKEIQKLNPSEPLKREREKSSGIKSKGWENRVYTVLLFSTIAVLFVGACFLLIFLREYMWVGIVISIPVGIMFVAGILYSTDILGVIIKNDDGGSLSIDERMAILVIGLVVLFLNREKAQEWLLNYVQNNSNIVLSDTLTAVIYVGATFTYIFLMLAVAPALLYYGITFLKYAKNHFPFKQRRKQIGDYFVSNVSAEVKRQSLLINTVKYINNSGKCIAKMLYILFPLIYCFDVLKMIISCFFVYTIGAIGFMVLSLRKITREIIKALLWTFNLSEKRSVAVSFRLALILSFVIVAATNRYEPIFNVYEESTAVFEFVASAVIIPVIFEWIYSLKSKSKNAN